MEGVSYSENFLKNERNSTLPEKLAEPRLKVSFINPSVPVEACKRLLQWKSQTLFKII